MSVQEIVQSVLQKESRLIDLILNKPNLHQRDRRAAEEEIHLEDIDAGEANVETIEGEENPGYSGVEARSIGGKYK